MKQHITDKQWMEIKHLHKRLRWDWMWETHEEVDIGDMIQFLGDNWIFAVNENNKKHAQLEALLSPNQICDNLWEACKKKLIKKYTDL